MLCLYVQKIQFVDQEEPWSYIDYATIEYFFNFQLFRFVFIPVTNWEKLFC